MSAQLADERDDQCERRLQQQTTLDLQWTERRMNFRPVAVTMWVELAVSWIDFSSVEFLLVEAVT
ncbi:hypothetical protein PI124_g7414 [Phytophthora idaei]|nr:hypothetical protein PI126_g13991 [Phytophthora idaei]KAG3247882.1 hypothetical protein PI124_g7414 [Phytophthora idaei]